MDPSPSLLRASALAADRSDPRQSEPSDAQLDRDSVMLRAIRGSALPRWTSLLVVSGVAALAAFAVVRRPPPERPISSPVADQPGEAPEQRAMATPQATPPSLPPSAPTSSRSRRRRPLRAAPIAVAKEEGGGPLPHKKVVAAGPSSPPGPPPPARSPSAAEGAVPGNDPGVPPTLAPADEVQGEVRPLSEEERRAEEAAAIDADGVRFVVRAHLPQVRACYDRAFKERSPGGRVEIAFAVDSTGRAGRIRTEANTTSSEPLARCLEARVAEWQFPRPQGGALELVYPFVFASGG